MSGNLESSGFYRWPINATMGKGSNYIDETNSSLNKGKKKGMHHILVKE